MDKETDLTPEEIEVNDILKEAAKKIAEINKQIDAIPKDKLSPDLRPEGGPRPAYNQNFNRRDTLLNERSTEETMVIVSIDKIDQRSNLETRKKISLKRDKWLENTAEYPLSDKEEKAAEKDIMRSQSFMSKYLLTQKEKSNLIKGEVKTPSPQQEQKPEPKHTLSTKYYNQSLSYTFIKGEPENEKEAPVKSVERVPEKRAETKSVSASEYFSASLSYTIISGPSPSNTEKSKIQEKDIDIDIDKE